MAEFMGVLVGVVVVSLIVLAAIVGLVIWAVTKAVKSVKTGYQAPPYRHLDVVEGVTAYDVASVLKNYTHADAVGTRAKTAKAEVENGERKRANLVAAISAKFAEGSITWDKFVVAADDAYKVLLENCVVLANRIQTFDVQDYRTMARQRGSQAYKRDGIPDDVQDQRWAMLNSNLAEMDEIIAANERLLLELDRFGVEVGQLAQAGTDERTAQMLDEIRSLTEEAKLYR